jgi:hypothetical protein
LQALERVWPKAWGGVATKPWTAGQPLPNGPFDLIVSSHAINELFANDPDRLSRRTALAMELVSRLAPNGLLLLVEPALRRTGRDLLELRDALLANGLHVLAPCLHRGACPALERPRDWCHADRPWDAPKSVQAVAAAAGLARPKLTPLYRVGRNSFGCC